MRHESEGLWGLKSAADALVSYRPLGNYLDRGKDAIRAPLALPEHGLSFHVTGVTASSSKKLHAESSLSKVCQLQHSTARRAAIKKRSTHASRRLQQ